jgi:hypothetical protein
MNALQNSIFKNMKISKLIAGLIALGFWCNGLIAATFYVNASNTAPVWPYASWPTAATNIQDAITATSKGDTVLVTNGVYAFGGAVVTGDLLNRVALTNAITVQSVNGPWVTTILGAGATNGTAAVRCAWLTNGAALIGFTLTGGATRTSGDTFIQESGGAVWCAATNSYIGNCAILSNTAAMYGAGVYQGTIRNSLISSNGTSSPSGGAIYKSVLINCTVVGNVTYGASFPTAVTNCIIYFNGPSGSQNYSVGEYSYSHCCTSPTPLLGTGNFTNPPQLFIDGAHLTANSPCIGAGISVSGGTDIFGQPWSSPPSVGCAEWQPAPFVGTPQLKLSTNSVGFSIGTSGVNGATPCNVAWLQNGSPLQDNGHFTFTQSSNLVAKGVFYSDAGSYQLVVSNAFGMVTSTVAQVVIHCADAAGANPVAPYTAWSNAATNLQDAINAAGVGEIVMATNGTYSSGGLVMAGDLTNRVALNKAILATSVNGYTTTIIQGAWDPIATNGPGAVRCAWLADGAVLNGFTLQNGATRGTGDNGFVGFPLESGGGVWCSSTNGIVISCMLTNNAAHFGGGASYGTLDNSLMVANLAKSLGGGALYSVLNNCTVINNYLFYGNGGGGGTYNGVARNCIVTGNYDRSFMTTDNYFANGQAAYYNSCSTPSLPSGRGNLSADPKFIDLFHLSSISPCLGTGSNAYSSGFDLDGEAWNSPPSMGCDEMVLSNLTGPLTVSIFPGWTNVLVKRTEAYLATVAGRTASVTWSFGDGPSYTNFAANSSHQWTNGGDYTVTATVSNNSNPAGVSGSLLVHVQPLAPAQIQSPTLLTNGFQFQFAAQNLANYTIQYTTNLAPPISWQTLQTIYLNNQTNLSITDPSWTNGARFYRVLVQ